MDGFILVKDLLEGGCDVLGLFTTLGKAQAYVNAEGLHSDRCDTVQVQEWVGGVNVSDYSLNSVTGVWSAWHHATRDDAPKRVGLRTLADQLDDEGRN